MSQRSRSFIKDLLCLFVVFKQCLQNIFLNFSRNRTLIVWIEGEHADHQITTAHHHKFNLFLFSLCRAISVLLGEAWKSLPQDEREQYSQRAKLMADEQKKIFPDCWKRKRTLNTHATSPTIPTSTASSSSLSSTPPAMIVIRQDLMAARENSPLNWPFENRRLLKNWFLVKTTRADILPWESLYLSSHRLRRSIENNY